MSQRPFASKGNENLPEFEDTYRTKKNCKSLSLRRPTIIRLEKFVWTALWQMIVM